MVESGDNPLVRSRVEVGKMLRERIEQVHELYSIAKYITLSQEAELLLEKRNVLVRSLQLQMSRAFQRGVVPKQLRLPSLIAPVEQQVWLSEDYDDELSVGDALSTLLVGDVTRLEEAVHRLRLVYSVPDDERTVVQDADREGERARTPEVQQRRLASKEVFVVHGHDNAAKHEVARVIEKLGLDAVILHEQPNKGGTIIEKLESQADAAFVVVLLTPDDVGGKTKDELSPRARQNVVLELGYFVGRLRRSRVMALLKPGLEMPSDFDGVLYEPMYADGAWKLKLVQELRAAGLEVDANKLTSG